MIIMCVYAYLYIYVFISDATRIHRGWTGLLGRGIYIRIFMSLHTCIDVLCIYLCICINIYIYICLSRMLLESVEDGLDCLEEVYTYIMYV
jgi:hypothetical protein